MDGQTRRDGEAAGGEPAAIVAHRSTSGVIVPPRGASFMQWSFDTPEPSVRFAGLDHETDHEIDP